MAMARIRKVEAEYATLATGRLRQYRAGAINVLKSNLLGIAGRIGDNIGVPVTWEMINRVGGTYPFNANRRLIQRACSKWGIQPLAVSRFVGETLGASKVRSLLFPQSANPERFDPDRVAPIPREDLSIPADAITFGIFARMTEEKGQAMFLDAMVSHPSNNLHLVLAGGPTGTAYTEELRALAQAAQAQSRLHVLGEILDPERYYGLVDIAVNSRLDVEPFGISVIEAMLMKTPVLVHALGGPAETTIDGVTGWQVRHADRAGFLDGIDRALRERSRWGQIGRRARQHAVENYTPERQADRYIGILERLGTHTYPNYDS